MRRVAGDEHAPGAIAVGQREAQVPEPDMLERDIEFRAGRFVQEAAKIEIVAVGVGRNRRMEEPRAAEIDT